MIMSSPPLRAVFSYHQPHILHPPATFFAGRYDVYSCGVDAAVTEDIGKLGDIFFNSVKRAGEQVAEVMRKHFAEIDVRIPAKLFHFSPNIFTAHWVAVTGNKNIS